MNKGDRSQVLAQKGIKRPETFLSTAGAGCSFDGCKFWRLSIFRDFLPAPHLGRHRLSLRSTCGTL